MKIEKRDLATIDDIVVMVDSFYAKVNHDELLSYVFNDFAQVDWDIHLPKMYAFWNTLIFAKKDYKGNPFVHHIPLPIQKEHFSRWLALFEDNMDEFFEGEIAEATKAKARSIPRVFQSKLALS